MSDEIKIKIACYHSGYFKTEDGELKYLGGEVDNFEVDSQVIFEDVLLKMLDKGVNMIGNMWYKLPFEDLQDKRPLFEDIDSNKKKLTSRERWMGELEIYFEKPEVETSGVCAEEQTKEQTEATKKIEKGKEIVDEYKEEADGEMNYDAKEAEGGLVGRQSDSDESGNEEDEIPGDVNVEVFNNAN